jgi:2'-5' RNA ligase
MIERWRSFIAVTPGQSIHRQLQQIVRELGPACEEAGLGVGWVHPSKVHLTLRFLGDIPVPTAMALGDALRPLGSRERFTLRVVGIGAFPDASRPRVLWAGVSDPDGHFARIHEELTSILETQGIAREARPFAPHVTVGRVRRGRADLAPLLERYAQAEIGEEVVTRITFYRSILGSKGAVHEPKWVVDLGRDRRE